MDALKYPTALTPANWDKNKAALAKLKPTTLRAELDKLNRAWEITDWSAFSSDKLDSVDKAEKRLADLDKEAKRSLKALGEQADAVEKGAARAAIEFKKDKATPKEVLAAVDLVQKAAKTFGSDVDVYVETARAEVQAELEKLEAKAKKGPAPGAKPAETKESKFVRAKALECIRKIKAPAPGAKPWRFIVVKGTPNVAVCFLQAVPGSAHEKMLRKLLAGEKVQVFKDAKGEVIWEKKAVTLVSDRLPAGLAKKMQEWLKKLTKINVKIRIRKTTGEVEESEDGEDIPDELLKPDPAELAARAQAGKEFTKRLTALANDIKKAMQSAASADTKTEIKALIDSITAHGKAQRFEDANDDLDSLEALLDEDPAVATDDASPTGTTGGLSVKQLAQARLQWARERSRAVDEIKRLAQTLAQQFAGETEQITQVRDAVKKFYALADELKAELETQLDAALNASDPAQRAQLSAAAKRTVRKIQDLLDKDPVMREIDGNEIINDMKVVAPMKESLSAVEAALG